VYLGGSALGRSIALPADERDLLLSPPSSPRRGRLALRREYKKKKKKKKKPKKNKKQKKRKTQKKKKKKKKMVRLMFHVVARSDAGSKFAGRLNTRLCNPGDLALVPHGERASACERKPGTLRRDFSNLPASRFTKRLTRSSGTRRAAQPRIWSAEPSASINPAAHHLVKILPREISIRGVELARNGMGSRARCALHAVPKPKELRPGGDTVIHPPS